MIKPLHICLISFVFSSCGIASLAPTTLSNLITEALKDKFLSETRLSQVNNDGDLMFNGQITNYNINPIAIQANETASKNRLSITVKVNFINNIDKDNSFNKTFSRYSDYESSINFTSVEESLNEEIISQLIEDIFNEAFTNW